MASLHPLGWQFSPGCWWCDKAQHRRPSGPAPWPWVPIGCLISFVHQGPVIHYMGLRGLGYSIPTFWEVLGSGCLESFYFGLDRIHPLQHLLLDCHPKVISILNLGDQVLDPCDHLREDVPCSAHSTNLLGSSYFCYFLIMALFNEAFIMCQALCYVLYIYFALLSLIFFLCLFNRLTNWVIDHLENLRDLCNQLGKS